MKLRLALMTALVLASLGGCATPHTDLKSPCVGAEGSPCGPRRPVNDWWLKPSDAS